MPVTRRQAMPRTDAAKPAPRRRQPAVPFAAPLTTTREALLVDGSDAAFRELIGNLMTMANQLTALRAHLARRLGVSEPEYRVFLAIAQLQGEGGISVAAVARHLMVAGAFVTMIVQRLAKSGYVEKKPSHIDRRGVLLRLSARGARMMAAFADEPKAINDELFGDIDRAEFETLCDLARRIVAGGERALMVSRLRELGRGDRKQREHAKEDPSLGDEDGRTAIGKR
jgi:DNA-binding MarR family transcriptional regulator